MTDRQSESDLDFLEQIRALGPARIRKALHGTLPDTDEFPGFEILRELRRGGQGTVYEAVQLSTGRRVALKTLVTGTHSTEEQERRFEREIQVASDLRHPNIVTLYEGGRSSDGTQYFAMEYVEGLVLDEHVRQREEQGGFRLEERLTLFSRICEAMRYAHDQRVVHRDLKPSNVLVGRDGEPRVVDFGLAKDAALGLDEGITKSGKFLGTLTWAAPEQVEGRVGEVGPCTDIHALGLLLYYLVAGETPYEVGSSLAETVGHILRTAPRSLRGQPDFDVPEDLDVIVRCCLAKEPALRYPSLSVLLDDLKALREERPVWARQGNAGYRLRKSLRRHRAAVATVVLLLAAGALAFVAVWRGARRQAVDLHASRIREARLLARSGAVRDAEDILWPELLAPPPGAPLAGASAPMSGSSALATWALHELYLESPCARTVRLHDSLSSLGLSASGTILATVPAAGAEVHLWSVPSFDPIARLGSAAERLHEPRFGWSDGVVAALAGETVAVWSVETGSLLVEREATAFDLHPYRPLLAVVQDGTLGCIDLRNGAEVEAPIAADAPTNLTDVAWSNGENGICTRTADGILQSWLDGRLVDSRPAVGALYVLRGCSPRRCHLVLRWKDALIFGVERGSLVEYGALHSELNASVDLAELSSGSFLTTGGAGDQLLRVRAGTPGVEERWGGHRGHTVGIGADFGGERVVSGDENGWVKLWEPGTPHPLPVPERALSILDGSFEPKGERVALACTYDSSARVVSRRGTDPVVDLRACDHILACAQFAPDGSGRIASACYEGEVFLWTLDPAPRATRLARAHGEVYMLAFDRRGERLAYGHLSGVGVIDLNAGEDRSLPIADPVRVSSVAWVSDHALAWCGVGESFGVEDVEQAGVPLRRNGRREHTYHAMAVQPGGALVACGGSRRAIDLLDRDGELVDSLPTHTSEVFSLAFSHDGRLLAAGLVSGELQVWHLASRRRLAAPSFGGELFRVAFSPADDALLGVGAGGARIWELDTTRGRILGQVAGREEVGSAEARASR